jgi:RNA polymerase sigma factor (sigma-70 family)
MGVGECELRQWMVGGLDGNARAHHQLLSALTPLLRRYFARKMLHGLADVEDLVQDTLIAIHTRRISYDRGQPFTPWAYAIARHKLIDQFRRTKMTVPLDDVAAALVAPGATDDGLAALDIETLLASLPDKQARSIRDTKVLGLSVAEAAEQSGLSEADVKVSVHRGLKTLMGMIKS